MRPRKIISLILSTLLMLFTLCSCASQSSSQMAPSSSESSVQSSALSPDQNKGNDLSMQNVSLLGRAYAAPDSSVWLGLSATGISFDFTGTQLTATFRTEPAASENLPRIAIFVNGKRKKDMVLQIGTQTIDVTTDSEKAVSVQILKLSECTASCCAVTSINAHDGKMSPSAKKPHTIEFIGDSITCGYGIDDTDLSHGFSTATEDCTKAYAVKTAEMLDADFSLVSFSGFGIISGYTDNGQKNTAATVPQYYQTYGCSPDNAFDGKSAQNIAWDHSRLKPDAIVINLGTNDSSYTDSDVQKQADFTKNYTAFLKQVRTCNPNARIFCVLGTMGDLLNPAMKQAVTKYTEQTGDKNITTLDLPVQNTEKDGVCIQFHPSEKTHGKAAAILSERIAADMGWNK